MRSSCALLIGIAACVLIGTGGAAETPPTSGATTQPNREAVPAACEETLAKVWASKDAYAKKAGGQIPGPEVPVFKGHRGPAILLTNQGTLLAFGAQYTTGGDLGDHEIVVKRSTDGGLTWDPQIVIYDDGKKTSHAPCPVVDRSTGTVWLLFCAEVKNVLVTHSKDDGLTWAKPRVIAQEEHAWTSNHHWIQLSTGRLLVGAHDGGHTQWCYYSDDHGVSWKKGMPFDSRPVMSMSVVELADGSLYGNCRGNAKPRQPNYRRTTISRDGGITWSAPEICRQLPDAMGPGNTSSVIRLTDERRHDRNRVLFCGTVGPGRENLTAHISYDECKTWSKVKLIRKGACGYSDLVILPDMSVGVLFEPGTGYQMSFIRFSLDWLTDGKDKVVVRDTPVAAGGQPASGEKAKE